MKLTLSTIYFLAISSVLIPQSHVVAQNLNSNDISSIRKSISRANQANERARSSERRAYTALADLSSVHFDVKLELEILSTGMRNISCFSDINTYQSSIDNLSASILKVDLMIESLNQMCSAQSGDRASCMKIDEKVNAASKAKEKIRKIIADCSQAHRIIQSESASKYYEYQGEIE